jgi:hypothetical protein
MAELICQNPDCRTRFAGRSTRRFCCKSCKRRLEYLRRCWDHIAALPDLGDGQILPGMPATTDERRRMGKWNRELKANLGDRP